MTDIEKQALALVNVARADDNLPPLRDAEKASRIYGYAWKALYRALEMLEAYKREVSDAMKDVDKRLDTAGYSEASYTRLGVRRFIIPDPVDHLYEAIKEVVEMGRYDTAEQTALLRIAMKARGYAFTKIEEQQP